MDTPIPPLTQTDDIRVAKGIKLVEHLWWSLAKKIVLLAGDHYKWDDEQWKTAQELFLRPNDYKVIVERT